ncbi:MAG: hypothetical protein DMF94_22595 [Acidobacteria bacterium]|nr:MAG: hypothetical protein DMF94_22595 [Acidobacteriota bacterium]
MVEQNPTSRHAHLGLAKLLNVGGRAVGRRVRLGRALRRASQPRFRTVMLASCATLALVLAAADLSRA